LDGSLIGPGDKNVAKVSAVTPDGTKAFSQGNSTGHEQDRAERPESGDSGRSYHPHVEQESKYGQDGRRGCRCLGSGQQLAAGCRQPVRLVEPARNEAKMPQENKSGKSKKVDELNSYREKMTHR